MHSESQAMRAETGAQEGEVTFHLPATNEGVRDGVAKASQLMAKFGAGEEDLTAIELALAEVLNNVVEHAYAETSDGEMELRIDYQSPNVFFKIIDSGEPMPNGRLPLGNAADTDLEDFEQHEGGYGLFMIRQLARKLRYSREGHYNQLSFRITLGADRHWDSELSV